MPSPLDEDFLRFAAAGGYLTPEQAEELLGALREIEACGASATAPELALRREALDEEQVDRILHAASLSHLEARVPRRLGRFELIEPLGRGATGVTFKARDTEAGRPVALKVLFPDLARDAAFIERLRDTTRAATRLSHPCIAVPIEAGEAEGWHYLAAEFADGEPLADLVHREGSLTEFRALAIAAELAAALEHARESGIVHLAVRPTNILVTADGSVTLTDFALAAALAAADSHAAHDALLAEPAYAAPEMLRAEPPADTRADVFSLGAVLYEMLAGDAPFGGPSPIAAAAAVLAEPLPPLDARRPGLEETTRRVVEAAMAKDRSQRIATPGELLAMLKGGAPVPQPAAPSRAAASDRPAPGRQPAAPDRPPTPQVSPERKAAQRRGKKAGALVATAIGISLHVVLLAVVVPLLLRRCDRQREEAERALPPEAVSAPGTAVAAPTVQPSSPTTTATVPAPRPPAPPTPPPAKADTVDGRVLLMLRKAVADARQFAKRSPQDYAEQLQRYREALDEYAGAKMQYVPREGHALVAEARKEHGQIRTQARKAAQDELRQRRTRADAFASQHRITDAVRLLETFPVGLRLEGVAAEVDRLRRHYPQQALKEFAAIDAQARKLVAAGKLAEARALYVAIEAWQFPQALRRASAAVAQLDKALAARKADLDKKARAERPRIEQAVLRALAARDFAQAQKTVADALANPGLASIRTDLAAVATLARTASEVWSKVAAGLKATRPGTKTTVGGLTANFVGVDGDRVRLGAESAVITRRITVLKPQEALAFARKAYATGNPQSEVKLALFLLTDGHPALGRKLLEQAAQQGADTKAAHAIFKRFATTPKP